MIPNRIDDKNLSFHCFPSRVRIALNRFSLNYKREKGISNLSQTFRVDRKDMFETSKRILSLVGTQEVHSNLVAESLVVSQQSGHASHGIMRLIDYVDFVKNGQIIPNAQPHLESEKGAVSNVEGNWGWGQVACNFAVNILSEKVKHFGIAIAAINSCNHIGRLGEYVELLSRKALVAMMFCNTGPSVAAYGGSSRLFGTNPIAAAIPSPEGDIIIDFATAGTAEGKLRIAKAMGVEVQNGLVITHDGKPTTDPDAFYQGGALLPFGGHKGYCLSLMIELLGGALSGVHPAMNSSYKNGNGTLIIAMDPEFFVGTKKFADDVLDAITTIKSSPPIDSNSPILLPGEVEEKARLRNAQEIDIPEEIWISILNLEKDLSSR